MYQHVGSETTFHRLMAASFALQCPLPGKDYISGGRVIVHLGMSPNVTKGGAGIAS